MGRPAPTDKQLIDDGYKELDKELDCGAATAAAGDSATAAAGDSATEGAAAGAGRKSSRIAPLVDGSAPTGAAEPEASCGALRLFECLVENGVLSPDAIAVAEEELRRQASESGTTYVSRQPSAASTLSSKPRAKKARGDRGMPPPPEDKAPPSNVDAATGVGSADAAPAGAAGAAAAAAGAAGGGAAALGTAATVAGTTEVEATAAALFSTDPLPPFDPFAAIQRNSYGGLLSLVTPEQACALQGLDYARLSSYLEHHQVLYWGDQG